MPLPMEKIKASTKSPKKLVMFSKPKVGKTSLLAELSDSLIIDLENGTNYVDAVTVKCNSVDEIKALCTEIYQHKKKEGKFPYKTLIVDTITKLEDLCIDLAEKMYSEVPMGQSWFTSTTGGKAKYKVITNLPDGAGYKWLREAFGYVISMLEKCADRLILVGHLKDKFIEKNGTEISAKELDLTGKLKSITAASADAIGLLYRGEDNKNMLTFVTTDEVICGARPEHLRNQEFVVSELIDNKLITHWDKIYID
jgi:Cdc6-like AAA superfamily ATPase